VPPSLPGATHLLATQVCEPVQPGVQVTVPPQLSESVPHVSFAGQAVSGVQPQTFAVPPPPQVCGEVQDGPQVTDPPQPLGTVPQLAPASQPVIGVQPQTLGVPPPPHD
jgi:hypothetical protein